MKKKLKEFLEQANQWIKANKRVAYPTLAVLFLLLVLIAWLSCGGSGQRHTSNLKPKEAMDSLETMLPKGSQVVARYPDDERLCLYYMNSGVLYRFDGVTKNLEEIVTGDYPSGSIHQAKLSVDEQYITLSVKGEDAYHLYRINTLNRNIVDLEQTKPLEKEVKEEEKVEKKPVEVKKDTVTVEAPKPEPKPEPERQDVLQDVMEEPVMTE